MLKISPNPLVSLHFSQCTLHLCFGHAPWWIFAALWAFRLRSASNCRDVTKIQCGILQNIFATAAQQIDFQAEWPMSPMLFNSNLFLFFYPIFAGLFLGIFLHFDSVFSVSVAEFCDVFSVACRIGHCKSNSCSYVMPASTSARCPPIRPPRFSCTWVSSVSRGRNCLGYGLGFRFFDLFSICDSTWRARARAALVIFYNFTPWWLFSFSAWPKQNKQMSGKESWASHIFVTFSVRSSWN